MLAEAHHASLLIPLFEAYGFDLPDMPSADDVTVPASLLEAYALGVDAEILNIALYESFLLQDVPEDVKAVFEMLIFGSEHHLSAFERALDRETNSSCGLGNQHFNSSTNIGKKGPQFRGAK